jgi:putative PIN family toxin of toxin-antitoxin system
LIRAVLDTNVLAPGLAGFANPASTSGALLRAWRSDQFELVTSEPILDELARTLSRPYFRRRLSTEQVGAVLALLRSYASVTSITADVRGVATHPEDDRILATAVSGKADYLVTGDAQIQKLTSYEGVEIVSPASFIRVLTG